MTSRISVLTDTPSLGARNIPEMAAKDEPIIQDSRRTMAGFVPCRLSRFGSSTTAVVLLPIRVRSKSRYRPTPAASEKPVTARSSTVTLNLPRVNRVFVGR